MLISTAFAQTAAAPAGFSGESLQTFVMIFAVFAIFYFLVLRPQQRRVKQHKAKLAAIRRGDRIVTGGGVVGTVVKVINEFELNVEVSENVRVRVMRDMVAEVLTHGEPVGGSDKGGRKAKGSDKDAGGDTASSDNATPANDVSPKSEGSSGSKLKGFLGKKDS